MGLIPLFWVVYFSVIAHLQLEDSSVQSCLSVKWVPIPFVTRLPPFYNARGHHINRKGPDKLGRPNLGNTWHVPPTCFVRLMWRDFKASMCGDHLCRGRHVVGGLGAHHLSCRWFYTFASSLTMHHIDGVGDNYTSCQSNVRAVLCAHPLLPASHLGVTAKISCGEGMCLTIPFSRGISLHQGESYLSEYTTDI
jgi:hypothetical protein